MREAACRALPKAYAPVTSRSLNTAGIHWLARAILAVKGMSRTVLDPRLPWRTPPIDPRDFLLQCNASCSLAVTRNVPQKAIWQECCKPSNIA
jgi:hypothetical protein